MNLVNINLIKILVSTIITFFDMSLALSVYAQVTLPRPKNGRVVEICPNRSRINELLPPGSTYITCVVEVDVTDDKNQVIEEAIGFPKIRQERGPGARISIGVAAVVQTSNDPGDLQPVPVIDVTQEVRIRYDDSEGNRIESPISVLDIDAVFFDSNNDQYLLGNIFGTIETLYNEGKIDTKNILIPDLIADTNNDGIIGFGDITYGFVDLNEYLKFGSVPSFDISTNFDIVNGEVSSLPGMNFSRSPIFFDENQGVINQDPITGLAKTMAIHDITPVSVPESWNFLSIPGISIFGVAFILKNKGKR